MFLGSVEEMSDPSKREFSQVKECRGETKDLQDPRHILEQGVK